MPESTYREIKFTDADVVNPDGWIPAGDFNPHHVRPWLLHDHGFVLAVVFADSLQDALDEAVDAGRLDRFQLDPTDPSIQRSYDMVRRTDDDGNTFLDWPDDTAVAFLGNASEPFDIESVDFIELPSPARSFCAQFNAAEKVIPCT